MQSQKGGTFIWWPRVLTKGDKQLTHTCPRPSSLQNHENTGQGLKILVPAACVDHGVDRRHCPHRAAAHVRAAHPRKEGRQAGLTQSWWDDVREKNGGCSSVASACLTCAWALGSIQCIHPVPYIRRGGRGGLAEQVQLVKDGEALLSVSTWMQTPTTTTRQRQTRPENT